MINLVIFLAIAAVAIAGGLARARRQARLFGPIVEVPENKVLPEIPVVPRDRLAPEMAMRSLSLPEDPPPIDVDALRRLAPDVDEHAMALAVWKAHCGMTAGEQPPWPCTETAQAEIRERMQHGFSEVIVGEARLVQVLASPERILLEYRVHWVGSNANGWQERVDQWRLVSPTRARDWQLQSLISHRYGSPDDPPPFDKFSVRFAPFRDGRIVPDDVQEAVRHTTERGREVEGPVGATWRLIACRASHHRLPPRGEGKVLLTQTRLLGTGPSHAVVWVEGKRMDHEGRRFAEAWTFVSTEEGWILVAAA